MSAIIKDGQLTDKNIVDVLCPNFLKDRKKKTEYEDATLVYKADVELKEGVPTFVVCVGRLKNIQQNASTLASNSIAAAFGLVPTTPSGKDYILLRQRLELPAELKDNPEFIAKVGSPLTIKGVEMELTECMNFTEGESVVTVDQATKITYHRTGVDANNVERELRVVRHLAPKGEKQNVVIPFKGKVAVTSAVAMGALMNAVRPSATDIADAVDNV